MPNIYEGDNQHMAAPGPGPSIHDSAAGTRRAVIKAYCYASALVIVLN